MKVTQKRLAEILGVDRSTISKALAGHPGISDYQKQRVKALCDELNYVADYHGRTLSTGRTDIVSITRGYLAMDELVAARVWHFQVAAEARGMRIRLDGFDDALKSIYENSCDAVVVMQPPSLSGSLARASAPRNTPIVYTDCSLRDAAPICVCPDGQGGARLAAEHLISLGHERICFLGLVRGSLGCEDRYLGYRGALRASGLPAEPSLLVHLPDWPQEVTEIEAHSDAIQLALEGGCTAFQCSSDVIAAGVVRVLAKAGVRVPQEVSVAGFDDSTTARVVYPSITSVNQNFPEVAVQTIDLLQEILLRGHAAEPRRSVVCTLTVRESTGPRP